MKVQYKGDEARFDRAIDLSTAAATWKPLRHAATGRCWGVAMPSQTSAGVTYIVTSRTCTCADFAARGVACKHVTALGIVVEQRRAELAQKRAAA
jgi:hypothetical protein